jgi:hypothetical protein
MAVRSGASLDESSLRGQAFCKVHLFDYVSGWFGAGSQIPGGVPHGSTTFALSNRVLPVTLKVKGFPFLY